MTGLFISVALCTYNGSRFLPEQLQSVATQSRPPDELVVSDDVSDDDTTAIVESFAKEAPFPVCLMVNDQRLGPTKNFEKAIALCGGDLIALADQDDVWEPPKLALQEQALRPESIAAVFTDAQVVGEDLAALGYRLWQSVGFSRREQGLVRSANALDVFLRRDVVTGATLLFRSSLRDVILPVPEGWGHDQWIALLVATFGRFALLERPLLRYRQHGANQIGAAPPLSRPKGFVRRVGVARRTGTGAPLDQADRFLVAKSRLRELGAPTDVIARLDAKIAHLRRRATLPTGVGRVSAVLEELALGRYRRYSPGWRSAAKDLLVPR